MSKRIAFSGILLVFLLVALELASYVRYGLSTGKTFSWSTVQADRAAVIEQFATGSEAG